MIRKLMIGVIPALLLVGTSAEAAPPWTVSEVSGDVRLSEGGKVRAASKGASLGSGAVIATAFGARAVLVRGQEFVVISPNSRMRLPLAAEAPNGIVQIIQEWGSALFKIEKKATPHFGVRTPYLAAVVKGTTFTVTVGGEDAKVKVTEGAVEVSTLDGGAADMVRPGSMAMVGKSDLYRLTVEGTGAKEIRSNAAPVAGAITVKTPNEASVAKGDNRSARAESIRIARTIGEKPLSLGKATDGLVEGRSAAEHAQSAFNEHSRLAREPKPDKGDEPGETPGEDKPGKDDKPDSGQPGSEENPGKGGAVEPGTGSGAGGGADKPGDVDEGGKPAKPVDGDAGGKDKPTKGDDLEGDAGEKDKPTKGDDLDGDAGGKDKPTKGDDLDGDAGKNDKPAKGDDLDDDADDAQDGNDDAEDGGKDQDNGGKGD
jgi:hypothetical protein